MRYLADTNVLSELARRDPDPGVRAWARGVESLAVSAVTIDEISYGLTRRPNARVRSWFEAFWTRCDVVPVTEQIARQSGTLRACLASMGRTIMMADTMIAATAQVHGLTLVTRNTRHFEGCAVALLNPFTGA